MAGEELNSFSGQFKIIDQMLILMPSCCLTSPIYCFGLGAFVGGV